MVHFDKDIIMQRSFHHSPRSKIASNNKLQCTNEEASLVLDLQHKLINLESKYSRFVEKCTDLLKSSQVPPKHSLTTTGGFSTYRASSGTPHPLTDPTVPKSRSKSKAVKDIENGNFLRQVMGKISEIVLQFQEKLNKSIQNSDHLKKRLNEGLNTMLGEIWEILFDNENNIQNILKTCAKDPGFVETSTDQHVPNKNLHRELQKSKQKAHFYKDKYKSSLEKVDFLTKKLNDQHDCLLRIQNDHNKLREKLLHESKNRTSMGLSSRSSVERFNPLGTRSMTASPLPQREEVEELRVKNSELTSKIASLLQHNSVLQNHYRKPSSCVDFRMDAYEIEKREIQEQLKALQNKLMGFEKIAKGLIDTSIRTELSILDKKRENRLRQGKNGDIDSPELSLMNSHCSLLEADQVQKSLENMEKEKKALEKELKSEKMEKRQLGLEIMEKDMRVEEMEAECKGFREIEQEKELEIEILRGDLQRVIERYEEYKEDARKSKEELGRRISELEERKVIMEELEEKLGGKIEEMKENENIIESLKHSNKILSEKNKAFKKIIKENREEKTKILKLNSKHSKTISCLETAFEDLKLSSSSLERELDKFRNQESEISSLICEITQLKEVNQDLVGKLQKFQHEIDESTNKENKYEQTVKELEKELILTTTQLEETRNDLVTVRNEAEDYQQKMEEILANKNEIITSYESNNSQIPELTLELVAKKESFFHLEREYLKKSKDFEELVKSYNEVKDQLGQSSVKITQAMIKISELNDYKAKLMAERGDFLNENLNLKSQAEELHDKISQLETVVDKIKEKEKNINTELIQARKTISSLEVENKSMKEFNQSSQVSQAKLLNTSHKQISEYKTTIDEITQNLNQKSAEVLLLNSQIDEFKSKQEENIETRKKLKEVIDINKELKDSCEQKSKQIIEINKELKDTREQKHKQITDFNKELKDSREQTNKQITDMEYEIRKKSEEIKFLSEKINENRKENGEILEKIERYKRLESENTQEILKLRRNLEEISSAENEKLRSIEQNNRDILVEIQNCKEKELLLTQENQRIANQLEESSKRERDILTSVEEENKAASSEIQKYKHQVLAGLSDNQNILSIKHKEIGAMDEKIKELLDTIENYKKKDLIDKQENLKTRSDLETMIESLRDKLNLYEKKNREFSKDIEDAKQKELINIQENQRITEYFEGIINNHSEKIKAFEKEAGKVPALEKEAGKVSALQQKVSDLVHQTYKSEEEIALRDKDIKILTDKLQAISNENQESIIKVQSTKKSTAELLIQLEKLNQDIANLTESNSILHNTISKLESDNKLITEKANSNNKSSKLLISRCLSVTRSCISEIKAEFSMYLDVFNHFAPSFNKLQIFINHCETHLKQNRATINEMTSTILHLQETNKKLIDSQKNYHQDKEIQKGKEEENARLEQLVLENIALKAHVLSEEVKASKLVYQEKMYNEWKAGIENELLMRDKKIIELTVQISKNDKNIEDNEILVDQSNQITRMTQKIAEMENQILDLNELRRKININKQEFLQLDTLNQQLQQKIQEKNKIIEGISSSNAQLQNEMEKLHKELIFQKEINLSLATDSNPLKEKSDKLESNLVSLQSALSAQKTQFSDLQKILSAKESTELDIKLQLLNKTEEIEKLKCELSNKLKPPTGEIYKQIPAETPRSDQNPEQSKRLKVGDNLLVPAITRSKHNSGCIREERSGSKTGSEYVEGFNITSGKIIRKVTVGNKHWVLFQSDTGSFSWKDEVELQFSIADEPEEEAEEIKIALGEWYTGSIIQAIEKLKQASRNEISFEMGEDFCYPEAKKIEFDTNSFRGEMLQGGLEISIIQPKSDEFDTIEGLKAELTAKEAKIEKKKRTLMLHKDQILVLKEQMRKYNDEIGGYQGVIKELEAKLQSIMATDAQYIKQVFGNLVVKIKIDKNTEDLITLLFKILDFHNEEIDKLQQQRKGNKKLITTKKT